MRVSFMSSFSFSLVYLFWVAFELINTSTETHTDRSILPVHWIFFYGVETQFKCKTKVHERKKKYEKLVSQFRHYND